jgi:WD40 repeat protein
LERPDGPLLWALEGHDGGAFSVATTPDGRRAAVGTMRGEVAIWDLETGRRVRSFRGPAKTAWSVAITHDGALAAAAYGDDGIVVWDLATGSTAVSLQNTSSAMAVAFTADGKHIVGGEKDGSVRLWTVPGGAEAGSLEGRHESNIKCLVTAKDGRVAVTGAKDGTLGVWDLTTGKIRRLIPAHQAGVQGVWSLALDRTGMRALYVTDKGLVVLLNVETGETLGTFWPDAFTMGGCFIGNGERAVTCDDAGELKIWSLPEGKLIRAVRGHKGFVDSIAAFGASGVISASRDATARVWDLERQGPVEVQAHDAPVLGVAVSKSLAGVCSASQDKTLKMWNAQDGKLLKTIDGFDSPLRAVALLPATARLLVGDAQGRLARIELRGLQMQAQVEPHVPAIRQTSEGTSFGFGGVVSLRLVRDGTLAWSCGSAGDYVVWDLNEDKLNRQGLNVEPPCVGDITANGETVVLGLGNGSLAVLKIGEQSFTTIGGVSAAAAMDVVTDPSGKFAVSSHVDGALIAWELQHAKALLLIAPDRAAEGSVLSWETGKREPLSGIGAVVVARGLALTAGGQLLVAAFSDGWVRTWRLDNLQLYAAFHCDEALYSVAVDDLVVAVGGHHHVHLLKIHPE